MNSWRRFFCIKLAIAFVFLALLPKTNVFAYFSSQMKIEKQLAAATLQVEIDNLTVDGIAIAEMPTVDYNDIIEINTSKIFSFTVKNYGSSRVDYDLDILIAWEDSFGENGKLFVYPAELSDEYIYEDIINGGAAAIVGLQALDDKKISGSQGEVFGIAENIDSQTLDFGLGANSFLEYSLKLFFYADQEIAENGELFDNRLLQVGARVRSDISGRTTGWAEIKQDFFRLLTIVDLVPPVLSEISAPKTYFITQANDIDLTRYAAAFDEAEGDITDKIEIKSVFDPDKAGTYIVTYTVKNSRGVPAAPLQISITVWDFAKIASGRYHTLALTSHGKIYTWGYNGFGQLGDGTYTERAVPQLVEGMEDIIDVAAGTGCSFALNSEGELFSWGRNENGRLGDGTLTGKNRPAKVSLPAGVRFKEVSCRFDAAGALSTEGEVYTWGYGGYGTLGTGGTADIYKPTKINLSGIKSLEMGFYNGAAVTNDGRVYTWGSNLYGQMGNGSGNNAGPNSLSEVPYFTANNIKVRQVSIGLYHMTAVSDDGRLFSWGYGLEGRLGNNSTTNKNTPQYITLAKPAEKAMAGNYHSGVMTEDGRVYFFGQNAYGKHGDGTVTNNLVPKLLSAVEGITDFSLGYDSSFVLSRGRYVYGMGYGGTGVLGTGNSNNSTTPVIWAFVPPAPS